MTLTTLIYLSLAAWRIASLFANEDGPWSMFKRFRETAEEWCKRYRFCRELNLYELLTCEWCNSVWIGAILTVLHLWLDGAILYLTLPFALSTVVIIIKYSVELLQTARGFFEGNKRPSE
ncbi:MAG: DUF1360 domain-containing protein [Chloroflexota bacterium]